MDRNFNYCHALCKPFHGQARKSLWIETMGRGGNEAGNTGQARKSLWIETNLAGRSPKYGSGQARKSLWIETILQHHLQSLTHRSGS